jgi:hypothetical protein
MEILRRTSRTPRQLVLLCLLSLLWLQFGSVHLHSEHEAEQPHVHSLLSPHHADFHPDPAEADIDLTPTAATSPASPYTVDGGPVVALLLVLLFCPGVATGFHRLIRDRWRPPPSFFYVSPPLRAPPARS